MYINPIKYDVCIYHKNCVDGIVSAWAVSKYMKQFDTKPYYFSAYHSDTRMPNIRDKNVIIVDFSYSRSTIVNMSREAKSVTIFDHHKSAQIELQDLTLSNVHIIFDMNRCGAQITWDELMKGEERPWFIDIVADRDLYKWAIPGSKLIGNGIHYLDILKNDELDDLFEGKKIVSDIPWVSLLKYEDITFPWVLDLPLKHRENIKMLFTIGKVIDGYEQKSIDMIVKSAVLCEFSMVGGKVYKVALTTSPPNLRSSVGHDLVTYHNVDIGVLYRYNITTDEWYISMRTDESKNIDLSELCALLPDGGGHPNAAGFTIKPGHNLYSYFTPIQKTV